MPDKKPVIAIDIDDVVVDTAEKTIRFYNKEYGTGLALADFYSDGTEKWGTTRDEAIRRVNEYLIGEEFSGVAPKPDALVAIDKLKKKYRLVIVTGRPSLIEKDTTEWLVKHFPETFESIRFSNFFTTGNERPKSKGEIGRELGVSILIDDHIEHLVGTYRFGIKGLLFGDYPWNQADKLPKSVRRVKDWDEVLKVLL